MQCILSLWNLRAARRISQVESELKELDPEEAAEYLESLGATEGGLGSLVCSKL